MEDIKLILYVLAAVAYFVFMQWRKAFNSPRKDMEQVKPEPRNKPLQPTKPATSFEDILRELQPKLDKAEMKGKAVVAQKKQDVKPYVPPLAPVMPASEEKYKDKAPKILSWEKPAEALQAAKRSIEHQKLTQFESYDKKIAATNPYASLLRNPTSVREAVVLAEILKRKYD
ncbi:hypothetical protein ACXYMU_15095 [Pontibacter sp. CAU 1760]